MCEPFESADWWKNGYLQGAAKSKPEAATAEHMANTSVVTEGCLGGKCLKVDLKQYLSGGLAVHWPFSNVGKAPEAMHLRYYLKLGSNFVPNTCLPGSTDASTGGKFPGLADVRAYPEEQCGNGGAWGDGLNCWSMRTHFRNCNRSGSDRTCTSPQATTRIGSYLYYYEQDGFANAGLWDNVEWGQGYYTEPFGSCSSPRDIGSCGMGVGGQLENDRWYRVEMYVKMNTPGKADGIIKGWVDGVLSYQKNNMIFRIPGHDNLHVRTVWLNVFAGGTTGLCQGSTVYLDQVVAATDAPPGAWVGGNVAVAGPVSTTPSGSTGGTTTGGTTTGGTTTGGTTTGGTTTGGTTTGGTSGSTTGSTGSGGTTTQPVVGLNPGTPATITGGTFKPSYALPAAGSAVHIGTNTVLDVRPTELSAGAWNYVVFGCFGGGTFVRDFSAGGAYVSAGTGGHTCPTNVGAAVFDFADAKWKRIDNANGIPYQHPDYNISATNGAPYYELTAATAGQIPAPAHTYRTAVELPSRLGGGSRGSLLLVTRTAIAQESKVSGAVHRFDLSTGLWTRHINAVAPEPQLYEGTSIFDATEDKYWMTPDWLYSISKVSYLDGRDWTFKQTAAFEPSFTIAKEAAYGASFMDESRRLIIYHRGSRMVALDLKNPAAGWKELKLSQPAPSAGNRWVFYPPDGSFYYRHQDEVGQTLYRLIPPTTTDAINGTWNLTAVSIKGAALPKFSGDPGMRHYGTLVYVPALQMLAWIPGGANPVALIRPS